MKIFFSDYKEKNFPIKYIFIFFLSLYVPFFVLLNPSLVVLYVIFLSITGIIFDLKVQKCDYYSFFVLMRKGHEIVVENEDIVELVYNFGLFCKDKDFIYLKRFFSSKDTEYMKKSLKNFRKIDFNKISNLDKRRSVLYVLPKLQAILNERIFLESKTETDIKFINKNGRRVLKILKLINENSNNLQIPELFSDKEKIYLGWKGRGYISYLIRKDKLFYVDFKDNKNSQKLIGNDNQISSLLINLLDM